MLRVLLEPIDATWYNDAVVDRLNTLRILFSFNTVTVYIHQTYDGIQ
jgi:hypothetical protein